MGPTHLCTVMACVWFLATRLGKVVLSSNTDTASYTSRTENSMNADLKDFAFQWFRVALMALVPVLFTAFVCMPLSLGGHPGEEITRMNSFHTT